MPGVGRDLALLLLFAHEADHEPVIVCQCDSLLSRDLASGDVPESVERMS
jgi:hypothetical protein